MDKLNSRREFLKMAAALAGGTVVMASGVSVFPKENANPIKSIWRLNPAFRIKELSSTEIELHAHLKTGELLAHRFSGLEADLLRSISEDKNLESLIPELARGQNMVSSDCVRAITMFLNDFADAQLIYTGDKMMVKKVEIIHE
jgi:hypothetical protein